MSVLAIHPVFIWTTVEQLSKLVPIKPPSHHNSYDMALLLLTVLVSA